MRHWKVMFKTGVGSVAKRIDFNPGGWTHSGTFPRTPSSSSSYLDVWERTFTDEAAAVECYLMTKKAPGTEDITLYVANWIKVLPA